MFLGKDLFQRPVTMSHIYKIYMYRTLTTELVINLAVRGRKARVL